MEKKKTKQQMILFNTTFAVDAGHAAGFIDFLRDTYIPAAHSAGLHGILLTEMRGDAASACADGRPVRTLALQMRAPGNEILEQFRNDTLSSIYGAIAARWGMAVAMFESQLDVVYDHDATDGK